ncbi:MAG TPA: hypothetical protein VJN94_15045 [Candidatus Binataceae bacterium]|nr:hypothetical protein [Candidatus Binataceae bacterium]
MASTVATSDSIRADRQGAEGLYSRLEERILDRDQVGASEAYCDLVRAGRPLLEIVSEAVRIHGPYTHVPYHERIDDGYPNFVNNDHCLLSARVALDLPRMLPERFSMLPLAQTIWYIPSGLDIWNQKLNRAPGHYTRGLKGTSTTPPPPAVYWPDQQPIRDSAPLKERLGNWLTMVHRGEVIDAYRIFLGLIEEEGNRKQALAELVFAGMIDVQDRMLYNRSYTTGHKAYRARATVELGNAIGWDDAHHVLYAGALDLAVGPRWYSNYEMACNAVKMFVEGKTLHAVPYSGVLERETAALANRAPVEPEEQANLIDLILRQPEPAYIEPLAALLKAGRDPRRLADVMQLAAAQIVLETRDPNNFSMAMHCYEYCNTLGWFYDNFDHPRRLRLLFMAAGFLNCTAWHQKNIGELQPVTIAAPAGAQRMSAGQLLDQVEAATSALNGPESAAWTQAYLENSADRRPLIERIATVAAKMGNDTHNQEIAQCMLEDFTTNRSPDRDRLLIAAAYHTATHRKYGEQFEPSRRFGEALGISELQ